jgi:hypothetical protein
MSPPKAIAPKVTPDPAVTVLHQGLDTLVLNVYGLLREDAAECLAMAKEEAQASPSGEFNSPLPPFDGVTPRMQSHGIKYYEWLLLSRDVTVAVARPSRSRRPVAVVRVSSECLWRLGGGGAVAARLAAVYLVELFDGVPVVQVSRADMATDYQGHLPLMADRRGIVKRARVLREHFVSDQDGLEWHTINDEAQSFSAGRSVTIRISNYDKTDEIKKSGKEWFIDLWERHKGYVSGKPVRRNEFQLGREFLHERGIETVQDLLDGLSGLWAYAMGWFSFRTVNESDLAHRSRWPLAPWWVALSSWGASDAEPLPRVKVVRPTFHRLAQGCMGYITSVMVVAGCLDPYEAVSEVVKHLVATRGVLALDKAVAAKELRYAGFTMACA